MVKALHNAVFFVGEESLPHTTRHIALMTFQLCKEHVGRGDLIYVNDLGSVGRTLSKHDDHRRTFFVNGAACNFGLLPKIGCFGGDKVIVQVDLDDGSPDPKHEVSKVLKLVDGDVPILQLTDGVGNDHNSRIRWVLRELRNLNRPPIPPAIIEKVLMNHCQPEIPANTLAMV